MGRVKSFLLHLADQLEGLDNKRVAGWSAQQVINYAIQLIQQDGAGEDPLHLRDVYRELGEVERAGHKVPQEVLDGLYYLILDLEGESHRGVRPKSPAHRLVDHVGSLQIQKDFWVTYIAGNTPESKRVILFYGVPKDANHSQQVLELRGMELMRAVKDGQIRPNDLKNSMIEYSQRQQFMGD